MTPRKQFPTQAYTTRTPSQPNKKNFSTGSKTASIGLKTRVPDETPPRSKSSFWEHNRMGILARDYSGVCGSPNQQFGRKSATKMTQNNSFVPKGPRSNMNGSFQSNGNGNGNGNYRNQNYNRGNQSYNHDNQNHDNQNYNRGNQSYNHGNRFHGRGNQNYNQHNENTNYGNGNLNGNGNGNVNPNPNYKGKNFNPNYHGKNFNPNYKGKNYNPNHQGPRGGSVGDARRSPETHLNGQGPFSGPRNNRRNRNRYNNSLPDKFRAQEQDVIMLDAPPMLDEPMDTDMPDAPPLSIDPRIEVFNAGSEAVQEAAKCIIMKMAADLNMRCIPN